MCGVFCVVLCCVVLLYEVVLRVCVSVRVVVSCVWSWTALSGNANDWRNREYVVLNLVSNLKMRMIQGFFFVKPLGHVITLRGPFMALRKLAIRDEPNIRLRCSWTWSKTTGWRRPHSFPMHPLWIQNAPVCTFKTSPCVLAYTGRVLRNASAMTAEREALRMGIEYLTVLFPTGTSSFDFQVESTGRTVQYKLNAQSLRLFGLHWDVNDAHRAGANRLQKQSNIFSKKKKKTQKFENIGKYKTNARSLARSPSPPSPKASERTVRSLAHSAPTPACVPSHLDLGRDRVATHHVAVDELLMARRHELTKYTWFVRPGNTSLKCRQAHGWRPRSVPQQSEGTNW